MTRVVWAVLGAALLGSGCDAVPLPQGGEADSHQPPEAVIDNSSTGGDACPHTTDQFSFSLSGAGHLLACGAETGKVSFPAVVTAADSTTLELSTCPKGKKCGDTLQLLVVAQDLSVPLFVGAFVRVDAAVFNTGEGCAEQLMVRNLPTFNGLVNPVSSAPVLWLAGAEGTLATSSDDLFHVDDVEGCGQSLPGYGDDALAFTFAGSEVPRPLTLPMGASYVTQVTYPGAAAADALLVRNLRSFHAPGAPPGDAREFAYWITHVTPELP